MPLTEDKHPELPYRCIAFDSLIRADTELPGAAFQQKRPPARELSVRRANLKTQLEALDRKLHSGLHLSRELALRSRRENPGSGTARTWALEAAGVANFLWQEGSTEVLWEPGPEHETALFGFLLLHRLLPVYFAANRTYRFLHAGAVQIHGQAVVFLAPGMGGKSTLTDYFVNRGHALVTDDKLAIQERDGTYLAVGSYPFRRPWRETEVLGRYTDNFAPSPHPIRAIFRLRRARPSHPARVQCTNPGTDRFRLLAESRDVLLPSRRAVDFEYLAGMADRLPLFELNVPWALDRLGDVYEEVMGTLARSKS